MKARWNHWVALCDRREDPIHLAMIRIMVSIVLLIDLFLVWRLDLTVPLWAPVDAGGTIRHETLPQVFQWFSPTVTTTVALYYTCVLSLAAFGAGLFTRFSGLVFLLAYAQTAAMNDPADTAIDRLLRIVILILLFSRCGETCSLSARLRTGRWRGSGALVPAWPRYVIVLQLCLVYWGAGIGKIALSWWPWGNYAALYVVLQDPLYAVFDFGFLAHPLWFKFSQISTAVTIFWEWSTPLFLLALMYRNTRTRPGRVRAFFNRVDFRTLYVLVGTVFHIGLLMTLRLGIFPLGMLALYPAFFHPDETIRWRTIGRGSPM